MKNIYIDTFEKLIEILNFYQSQTGYVFRGQRDAANWKLEPSIFRQDTLDDYIKRIITSTNFVYPFANDTLNEWFRCKEVRDIVHLHTRQYLSYPQFHIKIKRLLWLCAYILKYNFYLGLYVEQNPNNHKLDSITLNLISKIPYYYWGEKQKFLGYFNYALQNLVTLSTLDDEIFKLGMHDNILTDYNQTSAQHYDFPTGALDFSEQYLIASHFAIERGDKNDSTCFSIYVYKQINLTENAPAYLIKEKGSNNIRAKNQHGVFLFIRNPCTYFLDYGRFPTIDILMAYNENAGLPGFAELIKYNILYKPQILDPLRRLLEKNNINEQTLKPDETQLPFMCTNNNPTLRSLR